MRAAALVVLTFLAGAQLYVILDSMSPAQANDKDFVQEYVLARALWDGLDTNAPIAQLSEHYELPGLFFAKPHPTPHPPTAGLVLLPLTAFGYLSAVRAWLLVELTCLAASVWLLARTLERPVRFTPVLLVAVLLVAWPPVGLDLILGQLTIPVLLALCGAALALESGRPKLAGVLLGLSLLLKPLAWPWLLVMARRRAWLSLGSCAATVIAGFGVVALREGPDRVADYFLRVGPTLTADFLHEPTNISIWTLGPRLFANSAEASAVVSAMAVGGLLIAVWHVGSPAYSLDLSLGFATAAAVVLSPLSWQFYLVLALLPAAYALRCRREPRVVASLVALTVTPFGARLLSAGQPPAVVYGVSILPALSAIALAAFALRAKRVA